MLKRKRQQKIRDLIEARRISTQDELTELLSGGAFNVTQSSISRDLEELGITKVNGFYALPKASGNPQRFGLLSLDTAGDIMIVAKTEPGLASAIALRIDRAGIGSIVGTVAGDDTIFIAVKNDKARNKVIKAIWETFEKLF
jgi:transcriptional regulator of arginine metabolism